MHDCVVVASILDDIKRTALQHLPAYAYLPREGDGLAAGFLAGHGAACSLEGNKIAHTSDLNCPPVFNNVLSSIRYSTTALVLTEDPTLLLDSPSSDKAHAGQLCRPPWRHCCQSQPLFARFRTDVRHVMPKSASMPWAPLPKSCHAPYGTFCLVLTMGKLTS